MRLFYQAFPNCDVLRRELSWTHYEESHSKAIRDKAKIMVDHFLEQVIGQNKIGGQARAMMVIAGEGRGCALRA